MDKKDKIVWEIIAIALVVVLYLFALNGRYEFENNVITDKWKQRSMYYFCGSQYEWQNWTEGPRGN